MADLPLELLGKVFLGNSVRAWLLALLAAAAALAGLYLIRRFAASRLTAWAKWTPGDWDDALAELLGRTRGLFLLAMALFIGSSFLALTDTLRRGVVGLAIVCPVAAGRTLAARPAGPLAATRPAPAAGKGPGQPDHGHCDGFRGTGRAVGRRPAAGAGQSGIRRHRPGCRAGRRRRGRRAGRAEHSRRPVCIAVDRVWTSRSASATFSASTSFWGAWKTSA